ncbi:MAG: two-component regulator propeller domain-containing protein, partial [Bacteroidota bacterium]
MQQVLGKTFSDSITFHHIEMEMSESSATQIFEDSYGFLWVGTPNGLNRFDGTSFQVYEKSSDGITGLTDGYIECIYEDDDLQLFIGSNRGLNIYDRSLNIIKRYPFKMEGKVLQSQYIGAIAKSKDFLWIGTERMGVYRYDTKSGETENLTFEQIHEDGPNNNYIVEIFPLLDNRIVIVTQVQIYVIDENLNILGTAPNTIDVSSALQQNKTDFWVGLHNGQLVEVNITVDNQIKMNFITVNPGYTILSLEADNNGNIWVGSENDGLSIYSKETQKLAHLRSDIKKPKSITSNSIWSLHKAKNGVMWVGPFKQGLSFYDPDYYKFTHIKKDPFNNQTLSNNIVNCFAEEANGNLWIGTDGGGLNYWDRNNNTFKSYALDEGNLNSNVVLCLFQDDRNRLWTGTWAKGLTFFDPETETYTHWKKENSFLGSNNVLDIIQDQKGRVWIATLFGGLHVYYPATNKHRHFRLESEIDGSEVITMARLLEDKSGNVWVGTQTAGLFRIFENGSNSWSTQHYHSLDTIRGLSNDFINTIIEDEQGTIWIGTQAGLNQYDSSNDTFKSVTKSDGLKDDAIKGIIKDKEGFLWLSTGNGIVRYQPDKGQSQHYDDKDGLQGNQFNAASFFVTQKNELLFGGSNGFNIFTIANAKKRENSPKIYLSGLKVFNKSVIAADETGILDKDISQTDTVTFDYDQSVINFDFRAITYRHPQKVKYAYYLDGFESEWNYVDNPGATYTNLSPGTYTLRIKSTNSDGVWGEEVKTLTIIVTPPFWATWWFLTLLGLVVLGAIYSIYLIRIRNLKSYQILLEDQINERTRELKFKQKKLIETADELSKRNEEI